METNDRNEDALTHPDQEDVRESGVGKTAGLPGDHADASNSEEEADPSTVAATGGDDDLSR